jgi:hypothetical protein
MGTIAKSHCTGMPLCESQVADRNHYIFSKVKIQNGQSMKIIGWLLPWEAKNILAISGKL